MSVRVFPLRTIHVAETQKKLLSFLPHDTEMLDYLSVTQKGEIKAFTRAQELSWLSGLNDFFEFAPESFVLAVNFFDRFLSTSKVQEKHLHIIAVACFFIASKFSEEHDIQPKIKELVSNSGSEFTERDLLRMEKLVLCKLNWQLNPVTALHVLNELVAFLQRGSFISLASILAEATRTLQVCLLHYELARVSPVLLAMTVLLDRLEQQATEYHEDEEEEEEKASLQEGLWEVQQFLDVSWDEMQVVKSMVRKHVEFMAKRSPVNIVAASTCSTSITTSTSISTADSKTTTTITSTLISTTSSTTTTTTTTTTAVAAITAVPPSTTTTTTTTKSAA